MAGVCLRTQEPPPPGATEDESPGAHRHRECSPDIRLWLPLRRGEEATLTPHPFCIDCGAVRNLSLPQGRPLGYYLSALATLKQRLGRSPLYPKLVQAHTHLIAERLSSRLEFEDRYATPGEAQMEAFVEVVRSVRPDLGRDDILEVVVPPRRVRRPRPEA